MSDLLSELVTEPRSLTEELFGRPEHVTVFISSKMRSGTYVVERARCAETVDRTGLVRAWYWERDANAGPYCPSALEAEAARHCLIPADARTLTHGRAGYRHHRQAPP